MVNEHYVPQSYLRQFAPDGEGLISRYSLVNKNGGGDYYSSARYSVRKAASEEGYANGIFENEGANQIEDEIINIFQKLSNDDPLDEFDCGVLSQFVVFQMTRTPKRRLFHQSEEMLSDSFEEFNSGGWLTQLDNAVHGGHKGLQQFGWILIENNTKTPFITSDHPVIEYNDKHSGNSSSTEVQVFYPIGPDYLLALFHPEQYSVQPMYPEARLEHHSIQDPKEIHKINQLQPLSAFNEVFGPINKNKYIESLVKILIDAFGNADYIRGPRCDRKTLEQAHRIATDGYSKYGNTDWYQREIKPIILAEEKKATAINQFEHGLSFVDELRDEG